MNLQTAELAIEKAINKANTLNVAVNIAIVDTGGHLICLKQMDNALLGAIDISVRKAKTSVLFQKPTHVLGEKSIPGGPLYGIENSNNGLITFAGGLPFFDSSNKCIGAIGVSGSTIENDLEIAMASLTV